MPGEQAAAVAIRSMHPLLPAMSVAALYWLSVTFDEAG
jgi:hypothetical protein